MSGKSREKFFGKRDRDLLHGFRIPEEWLERTSLELRTGPAEGSRGLAVESRKREQR
jgi:hypothetical protein